MTGRLPTFRNWPGLLPGLGVALALLGLAAGLFSAILGAVPPNQSLAAALADGLSSVQRVLAISLLQAGLSSLLAVGLGLLLAWCLSHQARFFGRRALLALMAVAMVLPSLVVVLGLVTVLGRRGWISLLLEGLGLEGLGTGIYGLGGILTAHVYLNAPFVALALLQRLEALPPESRKLAASLGLGAWRRFKVLEWPAVAAALPALGALVFLLCFTSFAVVLTLGGTPRYNTLEVEIYEAIKLDFDLARALTLAVTQLLFCGFLVYLASGLRASDSGISVQPRRLGLAEPPRRRLLQRLIIALAATAFLAPLAAVALDGLAADVMAVLAQPIFGQAFITSVTLASLSSLATLSLALPLAAARSRLALSDLDRRPFWRLLERLLAFAGTLYLAVPALVLGLGCFLIARRLSGDIYQWSPVALLLANLLMALPFALAVLTPALEKSFRRHDRLATALGLGGFRRWQWVEGRALAPELAFVAAIAFCFSLGDLGVIALFGNRDFTTLPWLLYQKMGAYRTSEAEAIAFLLLLLTFAVFFLALSFKGRRHA